VIEAKCFGSFPSNWLVAIHRIPPCDRPRQGEFNHLGMRTRGGMEPFVQIGIFIGKFTTSEGDMLLREFSERAAECIRLAERARSDHDRDLFIGLARAWCGVTEKPPETESCPRQHWRATATQRNPLARKYSRSASKGVKSAMRKRKHGTLKRGKGGRGGKVKSRKQAIAIGLAEARQKGKKVPKRKSKR
jgi:hypothetical protein